MDPVVRLQPLDGPWQTLGTGRFRGIVPELDELSANVWGPDQASFRVKSADGRTLRSDLLPYTPVEVEIGGLLCWAGRVRSRPSAENEHTVNCEGWQYHLDDNVFDRVYVHTRLGDCRDQRTFLSANLAKYHVAGVVATDDGAITIGWPNGAVLPALARVGITLDLGPDSIGKRLVMTWDSTNNAAGITCFGWCTDVENGDAATSDQAFSFVMNTGASGTSSGTFATARRFIHVFLSSAAGATLAADVHLRIKSLQVFRTAAYESGNASILKADAVVKDALTFAPQLNQTDLSQIAAGTFSLPEYLTGGYVSPREAMEAVNAYENFRMKIGGADLQTLVFGAKPTAPLYEVGEWSGSDFADASVSGDEIYSRFVTDATGPDGARLVSSRTQTGTLVDRRGYQRARVGPIRSAVTQAVADRFGDLYLTEHDTAPFSGRLSVQPGGVRPVQGGGTVPPHALLLAGGEKIRLSHRIDPDTGAFGRDGRIAGVTYRHATRTAEIDIDDRRGHFEEILSRYGLIVDGA